MYVDTHCHLHFDSFTADREQVIQRAIQSKVNYLITLGTDLESSEASIALADKFAVVYAAIGVHPNDAAKAEKDYLKKIVKMLENDKVVAIGEIGLDYYRDYTPRKMQHEIFREQINLAREHHLPMVIHNRDAHDDLKSVLKEERAADIGGVLHSFSGSPQFLKEVLDMNFYVSFTGVVTFTNADYYKLIDAVPLQQLLLETDSPFLAPVPFRGKRNEPSYLKYSAEKISKIKNISLDELSEITTENAKSLFNLK